MAFRSAILPLALPLPSELEGDGHLFLHDGWIAVLASLRGRVVADPRVFTRYRQHSGQFTGMQVARAADDGLRTASGHPTRPRVSRRDLADESARVRLVLDRVRERDALDDCRSDDAALLIELDELLAVRASEPGRARVLAVVRLLLSGSYRIHARGWRTAAADLVDRRR